MYYLVFEITKERLSQINKGMLFHWLGAAF